MQSSNDMLWLEKYWLFLERENKKHQAKVKTVAAIEALISFWKWNKHIEQMQHASSSQSSTQSFYLV